MAITGKERFRELLNNGSFDKLYTRTLVTNVDGVEYTSTEAHTLIFIQKNPGMSNIEIATALGKTKGAISQMTKKLSEKGLLEISNDPKHGRRKLINITEKGLVVCKKHAEVDISRLSETIDMLISKYDDKQVDFALHILSDIIEIQNSETNKN